jgi:hypothetical protein
MVDRRWTKDVNNRVREPVRYPARPLPSKEKLHPVLRRVEDMLR